MATTVQGHRREFDKNSLLNTNNLHFQPLSARILRGMADGATGAVQFTANCPIWVGKTVTVISKGALATGCILNSVVAITEGTATLAFALLGSLAHTATGCQIEFLQKYTVQCFAYSFNSYATLISQFVYLGLSDSHLSNVLIDHATYFFTAFMVHAFIGSNFDYVAGRSSEEITTRLTKLVIDEIKYLTDDLIKSCKFENRGTRSVLPQDLTTFLRSHPQHQRTIDDFSLEIMATPEYQQRLSVFIDEWLVAIGIDEPQMVSERRRHIEEFPGAAATSIGTDAHTVATTAASTARAIPAIGQPVPADAFNVPNLPHLPDRPFLLNPYYTTYLQALAEASTIKAHNDLAYCFSDRNDITDGQANITGAMSYIGVAKYAQFVELNRERIVAPAGARANELTAARNRLIALSPNEKAILLSLLIKESNFDLNRQGLTAAKAAEIQNLSNTIGNLATAFYRGAYRDNFQRGFQAGIAAV